MMIRKTSFATLILIVWLANLSGEANSQTDGPQWKLEQGDQFAVTFNQSSKSLTKVDSREITVDNVTVVEMDWEVTAVDDQGVATIEQSLTRVKLGVNGFARIKKGERATPLKDIGFDTAAPEGATKDSKTLLKQIQPLIGLKFSVMMAANGEITDVTVSQDVTDQLNKMPDARNLKSLFSAQGWKKVIGASAIVLPVDLEKGKSWKDETTVTTGLGKLDRVRTYTFVGEKEVDGKPIGEFDLAVEMVPVASDSIDDTLKSKLLEFSGSGKLVMDLDGGYLKSSKIENRTKSEKPYREKTISTTVTNETETIVSKK